MITVPNSRLSLSQWCPSWHSRWMAFCPHNDNINITIVNNFIQSEFRKLQIILHYYNFNNSNSGETEYLMISLFSLSFLYQKYRTPAGYYVSIENNIGTVWHSSGVRCPNTLRMKNI